MNSMSSAIILLNKIANQSFPTRQCTKSVPSTIKDCPTPERPCPPKAHGEAHPPMPLPLLPLPPHSTPPFLSSLCPTHPNPHDVFIPTTCPLPAPHPPHPPPHQPKQAD